jgi:hypothetical protein
MRAQIEVSRGRFKIRDIAVRPGHVEMEIVPKAKDPDKPMRQWKSRGIHLGLWDDELVKRISYLFSNVENGHEFAIHTAGLAIFDWFETGVVFEISAAESPHDFDVSLDFPAPSTVSSLPDSR